jgi:carboxyl-terminal processing protease
MRTTTLPLKSFAVALVASVLALSAALPAAASGALPAPLAQSVNDSYRLLVKTYYEPVNPQRLIDAARAALADDARTHNERITVAPISVTSDPDVSSELDQAIADAADATHVPDSEMAYAAMSAMARSVNDKYTVFMTPEQFKQFNQALDPKRISGIGVLITADATTKAIAISYVIPHTPADRGGLEAGDDILSIDDASTKGMSVDDASKLLRGKPGSVVDLTVARGVQATPRLLAITRSEIQPPTVVFKMLPGDIGYVYVLAFGKDTPAEFDTAIARLKEAGAKALVLDLRNDGGGYVDSALEISSHFVADKALLTVEQRGEPDQTIDAEGDANVSLPLMVLVNQGTASASEITAGALQDDGVAQLVGTRTFGKGVMQTLTPLADGSAIKITTAHYLTPNHHDINLKGIVPDISVDENHDARFGDAADDAQLRAAITLLQKKIADAKP